MNNFIKNFPGKIYHGTISKNLNSLKKGIKLNVGEKCVDFGMGFYTTSNCKQASSFAKIRAKKYNLKQKRKSIRYKKFQCEPTYPLIMVYNLNKEKLSSLDGCIFNSPGRKWAEFIYNNRLGREYSVSDFHNLNCRYDYVYGCLADSSIALLIQDIKMGKITYEQFCNLINPYDRYNQNQLSFNTEKSLLCLELVKYEIIQGR